MNNYLKFSFIFPSDSITIEKMNKKYHFPYIACDGFLTNKIKYIQEVITVLDKNNELFQ